MTCGVGQQIPFGNDGQRQKQVLHCVQDDNCCWVADLCSLRLVGSGGGDGFFLGFGEGEAAAAGVEVEEFGVAAPVDGGFDLALGLVGGELFVEHVEEEFFGNGVVGFGFEGTTDLAEEENVLGGGGAKEFFLVEDLGVGEVGAGGGDGGVAFFCGEEAEDGGGVDDGKEVVDFKG